MSLFMDIFQKFFVHIIDQNISNSFSCELLLLQMFIYDCHEIDLSFLMLILSPFVVWNTRKVFPGQRLSL